MKTIELWRTLSHSKRLLRNLYRNGLIEHYFVEDEGVIVRTKYSKKVLEKLKGPHPSYAYPYSKGKYTENKRYGKYQKDLQTLFKIYASFALFATKKEKKYLANRIHHCFLNMNNFEYRTEAKYYLYQSAGYLEQSHKENGSLVELLLHKVVFFLYTLV